MIRSTILRTTRECLFALALMLGTSLPGAEGIRTHRVDNPAQVKEQLELLWEVPERSRSQQAKERARIQPKARYGVANRELKAQPTDREIQSLAFFSEPLQPTSGTSTTAETLSLASALRQYQEAGNAEAIAPLTGFLDAYPDSRWAASLWLNLGRVAYDTGYFSDALAYWWNAWESANEAEDKASTAFANLAIAEYAKMCARVGRMDELERVFALIEDREFQGDARILIDSAREGYFTMVNDPGVAFRCGPYALTNIAPSLNSSSAELIGGFLEEVESPPVGFSLSEVNAMSDELGLSLQMAKRDPGGVMIVPSLEGGSLWRLGSRDERTLSAGRPDLRKPDLDEPRGNRCRSQWFLPRPRRRATGGLDGSLFRRGFSDLR